MYTKVKLQCIDQTLTPISLPKLASGGRKSVRVEFTFDSLWDGFGKTAIFYRDKNSVHHEVLTNDACKAPWHMIFDPGVVYVGVYGSSGGTVRTSEVLALTIEQGAITGASAMEPTPDVYQQVLAAYGEAERAIAVERARIDNFVSGDPANNAEVQDIRVGHDGKTYASAGAAVRTQFEYAMKGFGEMPKEEQGDFPYTSVDNFPPNSIITIGYPTSTWLLNRPTDTFTGTIITFNYTKTITGGMVQIAFNAQGTVMYTRCGWGGTNSYGAWVKTPLGERTPTNANAIIPSYVFIKDGNTTYTSFNDLPANKVFVYEYLLEDAPEGLSVASTGTVLTYNFNTDAAGSMQVLYSRSTKTLYVRQCWGSDQEWTDWERLATNTELSALRNEVEQLKGATVPVVASFLKIGCVGDSLASGESQYTAEDGSTGLVDLYEHSWGRFMARRYGIECVNFSAGGLSTRTWLTHSKGWTMAQEAENLCNAYIIGLGQNDRGKLGDDYLGTIADIDVDNYENNADTYYGNYGKIIQKLKTLQPKAKFFLLPDPIISSEHAYNTAVAEIANLLPNCYFIDLTRYAAMYTKGGFFAANKRGGHYNSIAYNYMGQIIGEEISKYMLANPTEFAQVEFIGTEYAY